MSEWISVKDRMPELDRVIAGTKVAYVLVFNDEAATCLLLNGKWYFNNDEVICVTHWMPLPEPPK